MISLRKAIEQGKLTEFIAEHEGEIGDADALGCVIRSMAGTSKEASATSPLNGSDD